MPVSLSSRENYVVWMPCLQGFKLLDIKMVPLMPHRSKKFSTHTWTGIVKQLRQVCVIANLYFCKGEV